MPVGGGGLITAIASYVKSISPSTKIIACQPRNNACMTNSVLKGYVLPVGRFEKNGGQTISQATIGGVERTSFTYTLCKAKGLIDQWVEVSEAEIEEAIVGFHQNHNKVIEGAAAVAVAGYIRFRKRVLDENVAIIVSGRNIPHKVMSQFFKTRFIDDPEFNPTGKGEFGMSEDRTDELSS